MIIMIISPLNGHSSAKSVADEVMMYGCFETTLGPELAKYLCLRCSVLE